MYTTTFADFETVLEKTRVELSAGDGQAAVRAEAVWRTYLDTPGLDSRNRGRAMGAMAQVLLMRGVVGEAEELFLAAIPLLSAPADQVAVLCGYAQLLHSYGRVADAGAIADQLDAVLRQHGTDIAGMAAWGYSALASLWLLCDEYERALADATRAVEVARSTNTGLAESHWALAKVAEAMGDISLAMEALEDAMVEMQNPHCLMSARAEYGRLALSIGDTQTAVHSLTKAVEFPDLRDRRVLAKVLRAIAELCKVDPEAAVACNLALAARLEGDTRHLTETRW